VLVVAIAERHAISTGLGRGANEGRQEGIAAFPGGARPSAAAQPCRGPLAGDGRALARVEDAVGISACLLARSSRAGHAMFRQARRGLAVSRCPCSPVDVPSWARVQLDHPP